MLEGGVLKEGRSEGRTAGSVYICHLLLLQAEDAQVEQGKGGGVGGQGGGRLPPARGASLNRPTCILKLNSRNV